VLLGRTGIVVYWVGVKFVPMYIGKGKFWSYCFKKSYLWVSPEKEEEINWLLKYATLSENFPS
jgi:hypothetical protein